MGEERRRGIGHRQLAVADRGQDQLVAREREDHGGQHRLDRARVPARDVLDEVLHACSAVLPARADHESYRRGPGRCELAHAGERPPRPPSPAGSGRSRPAPERSVRSPHELLGERVGRRRVQREDDEPARLDAANALQRRRDDRRRQERRREPDRVERLDVVQLLDSALAQLDPVLEGPRPSRGRGERELHGSSPTTRRPRQCSQNATDSEPTPAPTSSSAAPGRGAPRSRASVSANAAATTAEPRPCESSTTSSSYAHPARVLRVIDRNGSPGAGRHGRTAATVARLGGLERGDRRMPSSASTPSSTASICRGRASCAPRRPATERPPPPAPRRRRRAPPSSAVAAGKAMPTRLANGNSARSAVTSVSAPPPSRASATPRATSTATSRNARSASTRKTSSADESRDGLKRLHST